MRFGPSYVYFIRRADGEGPVKIGCSGRPESRLDTLMCWAPYPLKVATTIPGDEDLERRFHAHFKAQHSHREWFHPSAELDAVIAAVSAGEFDLASLPEHGKRLSGVRVAPPEQRQSMGDVMRVNWMRDAGYPIPDQVNLALRGRYGSPREAALANRAVVRLFVEEHHAIARATLPSIRRKRAA